MTTSAVETIQYRQVGRHAYYPPQTADLSVSRGYSCTRRGPGWTCRSHRIPGPGTGRETGGRPTRRGCRTTAPRTVFAPRNDQAAGNQRADALGRFDPAARRGEPRDHLYRQGGGRPLAPA